jgi:hypothetical protein
MQTLGDRWYDINTEDDSNVCLLFGVMLDGSLELNCGNPDAGSTKRTWDGGS